MAALPQVAVQDGVQGHGIGSALVTEVIAAMAHLGFEMIHDTSARTWCGGTPPGA
ncbi:MAG: family N-acetyltransferase [Mycobacterium sp.]|jgi:predicted N-acetyltransferase YhbS|nr:family N-acetyltransferase [Mycobacterium sp.]